MQAARTKNMKKVIILLIKEWHRIIYQSPKRKMYVYEKSAIIISLNLLNVLNL